MNNTTFYFSLLIIAFISCSAEAELYSAEYDEPGFKMTLHELRRSENTSTLKIDVIDSDAQGGFTIFKAACVIGKELGKSHFAFIFMEPLIKIFFTSDVSDDPRILFEDEMSERSRVKFSEIGYFELTKMCRIYFLN